MKILTDFDGVWTDPSAEAQTVLSVMREELASSSGLPLEKTAAFMEMATTAILRDPAAHGWHIDGILTAYSDEDPFCMPGAITALLNRSTDEAWRPLRDAVVRTFTSTEAFSNHCHKLGVARHFATQGPSMRPEAAEWIRAMTEADWDVVVVSNSSEEKLRTCFGHVGVEPGSSDDSKLRVRGGARKFLFTPEMSVPGGRSARTFAGRSVRLDRGHYLRVLEEERPDVVIGDVFSLDLALPLVLRENDPSFENLEIVLLENPYTPDWTREAIRGHEGLGVVPSMGALVSRLLERNPV